MQALAGSEKVGVQIVRELYGVMAAEVRPGGLLTSGQFTNNKAVGGEELARFCDICWRRTEGRLFQPADEPAPGSNSKPSGTPLCGAPMLRRGHTQQRLRCVSEL